MKNFAITNTRVFGSPDPGPHDVVVRDGLIEVITPAGSVGRETEIVDGRGHTLVPGLIDTHVHLTGRGELEAAAQAGVTSVVELGTHPDSLIDALRHDARHGGVSDIISAGSAASAPGSTQISMMGFPSESGVTGPEDAERYVAWRADNNADLIKIIVEDPDATEVPALSPETLTALVAGAHRRGLLTVAHVVTSQAFARGLAAGVDVLTHAPLDRPLSQEVLRGMADAGVVVSPTLVMMQVMARARLGQHAEQAFQNCLDAVRGMRDAGVSIIAGTDANSTPIAPVPHGSSLHDELDFLRTAGMTATEAVRAATTDAANALRLLDRGEISAGKRADLVLVKGDIDNDLDPLRHPIAVWVAGRRAV